LSAWRDQTAFVSISPRQSWIPAIAWQERATALSHGIFEALKDMAQARGSWPART
jgi:hypothetical protein